MSFTEDSPGFFLNSEKTRLWPVGRASIFYIYKNYSGRMSSGKGSGSYKLMANKKYDSSQPQDIESGSN